VPIIAPVTARTSGSPLLQVGRRGDPRARPPSVQRLYVVLLGPKANHPPKAVPLTESPAAATLPSPSTWSGSRKEARHGAPRRIREPPLLSSRRVNAGVGYASETRVRRGLRVVHGDKELAEKLGRNDLCPCGSAKRFQELLHAIGRVRRWRAGRLLALDPAGLGRLLWAAVGVQRRNGPARRGKRHVSHLS